MCPHLTPLSVGNHSVSPHSVHNTGMRQDNQMLRQTILPIILVYTGLGIAQLTFNKYTTSKNKSARYASRSGR